MKILLDGSSLGLKRGTGLSTHASELARLLQVSGHDVSCLYAMTKVKSGRELQWVSFMQSLNNRGELSSRAWAQIFLHTLAYAPGALLRIPRKIKRIHEPHYAVSTHGGKDLSTFKSIYNLPAVYRASQVCAQLSATPLRLSAPREERFDIFHLTSPLPLYMAGAKNVVTVHDLIPLTLPHSTDINLKHYLNIIKASLAKADAVGVVSEHSKQQLHQIIGTPLEKIFVTYQSASIPPALAELADSDLEAYLHKTYGLEAGGYFLYYGAIEPKKNVGRIIDAALASTSRLPLVIAGKYGWMYKDVKQKLASIGQNQQLGGRVMRLDYLPRLDLMMLVKGARALVFPSLSEGFGLPVLEAMSLGTPVITSRAGALPEIGGEAVIYTDPTDTGSIAAAMDRVAQDNTLCSSLTAMGLKQAEKFSDDNYYHRLQKLYASVMSG